MRPQPTWPFWPDRIIAASSQYGASGQITSPFRRRLTSGELTPETPNSAVTLNLKTLPGMTPDVLTSDQATELARKGVNYYVDFDGGAGFISGTTLKAGVWADAQFFLDWLVGRLESDGFNYMKRTKRPTSNGLRGALLGALEKGRASGYLEGREVSNTFRTEIANTIGNPDFDGVLPLGYFLYVPPESKRTQADRDARTIPGSKVWLAGSGTIHEARITVDFEN